MNNTILLLPAKLPVLNYKTVAGLLQTDELEWYGYLQ